MVEAEGEIPRLDQVEVEKFPKGDIVVVDVERKNENISGQQIDALT